MTPIRRSSCPPTGEVTRVYRALAILFLLAQPAPAHAGLLKLCAAGVKWLMPGARVELSDGSNLQIRRDDYPQSDVWREGMAAAVNETAAELKPLVRSSKATADAVHALHWGIARHRTDIAVELRERYENFNEPVEDHRKNYFQTDFIAPETDYDVRFRATLPERVPFRQRSVDLVIDGKNETLPISCYYTLMGQVRVAHSKDTVLGKLRQRGYELIAEVLNDRKLTEAQALDKLARAHFLLIEAPLTKRGAGSTSHALIDSVMRARFGHGLPPVKKGVVLDYEIFLRDIDQYAHDFPTLFEKP